MFFDFPFLGQLYNAVQYILNDVHIIEKYFLCWAGIFVKISNWLFVDGLSWKWTTLLSFLSLSFFFSYLFQDKNETRKAN